MTKIKLGAVLIILLICTGCGTNIQLQRGEIALEEIFESSEFYLEVEDGSRSKPDNLDGYVNLIWTNDEKRERVVAEHIQLLRTELSKHGFVFVETLEESSVCAALKFKAVRFDPIGGWITDDAQISYTGSKNGEELGTVVANEVLITPTIKMVFESLVIGSLELWGQTPDE